MNIKEVNQKFEQSVYVFFIIALHYFYLQAVWVLSAFIFFLFTQYRNLHTSSCTYFKFLLYLIDFANLYLSRKRIKIYCIYLTNASFAINNRSQTINVVNIKERITGNSTEIKLNDFINLGFVFASI